MKDIFEMIGDGLGLIAMLGFIFFLMAFIEAMKP